MPVIYMYNRYILFNKCSDYTQYNGSAITEQKSEVIMSLKWIKDLNLPRDTTRDTLLKWAEKIKDGFKLKYAIIGDKYRIVILVLDKGLRIFVDGHEVPQDKTLKDIWNDYFSNLRIYDDDLMIETKPISADPEWVRLRCHHCNHWIIIDPLKIHKIKILTDSEEFKKWLTHK